jgi:mono/diheme cytochrome c family protein
MRAGGLSEVSPTGNADWFSRGAPCVTKVVAVLAAGLLAISAEVKAENEHSSSIDVRIVAAWKTLRAVECARCHGKDYDGLAAPSIIEYARTQNREMFVRMVLDGDPPRGMPGYRDNPRVLGSIDDIYLYFLGRAQGSIGEGPPAPTP